jgi:hypothetical protein
MDAGDAKVFRAIPPVAALVGVAEDGDINGGAAAKGSAGNGASGSNGLNAAGAAPTLGAAGTPTKGLSMAVVDTQCTVI